MFCRFGVKFCHILRAVIRVLIALLDELDMLHDRIYCRCCEPTYISMVNSVDKEDVKDT